MEIYPREWRIAIPASLMQVDYLASLGLAQRVAACLLMEGGAHHGFAGLLGSEVVVHSLEFVHLHPSNVCENYASRCKSHQ